MSKSRAFWSQQTAQTKGFIFQCIAALVLEKYLQTLLHCLRLLWPRILILINWGPAQKFQKSQSLALLGCATPISCNADFLFSLDGFEEI